MLTPHKIMKNKIKYTFYICTALFLYFSFTIFYPTSNMPSEAFNIKEGESIRSITSRLERDGYIRSALIFRVFSSFNNEDKKLQYGKYNIHKIKYPNLINIYKSIMSSDSFEPARRLTIPEGFTTREIAERVSQTFNITADEFYKVAKDYNGYLYPETYFFSTNSTSGEIVKRLRDEFTKRVGDVKKEKVVLASIIEGEGKDLEDMKMIAGILNKRLEIGMPLQVDVAPITYKTINLPKSPINNPGVNAFSALSNPVKSKYLYYITGNDGIFYYAEDFDKHRENIRKYLK